MSPENAPFLPEHFKYYRPEDLKSGTVEYVILVDPAKTTNPRSCDTAIVVCGCDMVNNKIFVVDMVAAKLHPNEIYDNIMQLVLRWNARTVGVEYNGLNEFIEWPLKNALKRAGMFCEVIELKPRKGPSQYLLKNSNDNGKDARISAALVPLYRQGLIYHNPQHPVTVRLESQLCAFPSGRLKDIIDALSYVAEMLHIGERYMCNSRISMKKDVMPRDLITGFLDTASEDEALERLMAGDKNYGRNLKELVNA
jgi:phage terminase large subunit-like protein